ncbi:phage head-tail connector protein [Paenibacillus sp. ALE1]
MEPNRREALLTKLKILLGIPVTDTSKDVQLGFSLDFTINGIQNYCNISDIPEQLENTLLLIAKDYYLNQFAEPTTAGEAELNVQSVKRGDVQFNFAAYAKKGVEGTAFIKSYATQLNAFRKLRW